MAVQQREIVGQLALRYQMINSAQLALALRELAVRPESDVGDILLELGFLNSTQLAQLTDVLEKHYAAGDKPQPTAAARPAPPKPRAVPPPGPRPQPAAPVHDPRAYAQAQPQQAPQPHYSQPQAEAPSQPQAVPAVQPQEPSQFHAFNHAAFVPAKAQVDWLHQVLRTAARKQASDVHIHAGCRVKVRLYGDLVDFTKESISASDSELTLLSAMEPWQREHLAANGEVDFSYSIPKVGRYRVNVYRGQTGMCGVYHFIPAAPQELHALGLPETATKLVNHQNGIVLITGPSGSGKTSTMAALVNVINQDREDHVLSIEDPIEYLHTSKRCVINQRQINRHTKSFAAALRSALREDPDVICIGELRDLETIALALSAAETGHLVLGTLHTQGAVRTINRIIGVYPSRQQPQIRTMLSESLRAVLSQKLLPRADGKGVVLAYELMLMNQAAANLIRENRTFQLGQVLQTGRSAGMRSMDDSLRELLQQGLITKRVAQINSENPKLFV